MTRSCLGARILWRLRVERRLMSLRTKTCARCGRAFEWRKKWRGCWDEVRYCSQRCSRARCGDVDAALERSIVELLKARAQGATICPSEAARDVRADWRPLMERARMAARRLAAAGVVEVTQRGRPVDPSAARGAIRIRLKR